MANLAVLTIGEKSFYWKWDVPFIWLILFSPSNHKDGIFVTNAKAAMEKLVELGITLDKLEDKLSVLTNLDKLEWKESRINLIQDEINSKEYLDKNMLPPDTWLRILSEREGLYEITQLYKISILLNNVQFDTKITLDIEELQMMDERYYNIEDLYYTKESNLVDKMIALQSIFDFLIMDYKMVQIVLKKIVKLDERKLIDNVIIPLLVKMGFRTPKQVSHHGPREFGQDIKLFYEYNKFGQKTYYGSQVKSTNINMNSKKQKENAAAIANQLDVALSMKFIDEEDKIEKKVDKIMLITSGKITDDAKKYYVNRFSRNIDVIDGELLAENVVRYKLSNQVLAL